MMPRCSFKRCRNVGDKEVAKTWDGDCEGFYESLYLCKKHAKKIAKQLHIELRGDEEE